MVSIPRQGDYFLLLSGLIHAVGRYGCGAAVFLGPREDMLTLDINILSTHMPQVYRPDELTPLSQVRLADHGLCPRCRGWGLTSMYDNATMDEVLEGRHGDICPDCGGSGRPGVKVTIDRSPSGTQGKIDMSPLVRPLVCGVCQTAYEQQT